MSLLRSMDLKDLKTDEVGLKPNLRFSSFPQLKQRAIQKVASLNSAKVEITL